MLAPAQPTAGGRRRLLPTTPSPSTHADVEEEVSRGVGCKHTSRYSAAPVDAQVKTNWNTRAARSCGREFPYIAFLEHPMLEGRMAAPSGQVDIEVAFEQTAASQQQQREPWTTLLNTKLDLIPHLAAD
eukprot:767756-Hanusia_phi.AAC.3